MRKLSFIVPIYKVEPYLRKCVDSLLHQDYDDYEIILVDDGSPDNCPAICDEYATRFDRIRTIHQENRGLSGARNAGIDAAQGDYLCFVDSDDYWEENVLGALMTQIERDSLEVLRFNYRNVNESGTEFYPYKHPKRHVNYDDTVTNGEDFLNNRLGFACYAWQFIVKRELCQAERFTEGIYFEDTDWTPRVLLRANRVASTETMVYNYFLHDGSITQTTNIQKKIKGIEDKLYIIKSLQNAANACEQDSWFLGMVALLSIGVLDAIGLYLYNDRENYLGRLRSLKVFPIQPYDVTKLEKRKMCLASISPRLYVWLYHIKNNR